MANCNHRQGDDVPRGYEKVQSLDDYRRAREKNYDPHFYNVLETEDDLGAVIRAHIYIEYWLRWALTSSDVMCDINLGYIELLNRCIARDLLDGELEDSLRMLNSLRNKFAHKIDFQLTPLVVHNYYKTLKGLPKEIFDGMDRTSIPDDSKSPEEYEFRDMLCAVAGCVGVL